MTNRGLEQATQAGNHFKASIHAVEQKYGIKFDEVIIETSPFLRCLQTASCIASVLSIPKIHVNYRISESLYDTAFDDCNIFDELEVKTKDRVAL